MSNENQKNVNSKVDEIFAAFAKGIQNGDKRVGFKVRDYTRQEAPFVTGNLKNSVENPVIEGGSGLASRKILLPITASYASWIIDGTDPYEIHAKPGSVLRFMLGGNEVFTKKVNHPGIAANDFPGRGIEKLKKSGKIDGIYQQALNEAMVGI